MKIPTGSTYESRTMQIPVTRTAYGEAMAWQSQPVSMHCAVEPHVAATGLFYVTVLMARLVSLYSSEIAHSTTLRSRSRSRRPALVKNYGTARSADDLMMEMERTNGDHEPS